MNRLWWPDSLVCTFTQPDSTKLLPVGHMKSLVYKTPVDAEEDLLAQVMAVAGVGLHGIGVYENMVHRYCVCAEVAGHHIKPFL